MIHTYNDWEMKMWDEDHSVKVKILRIRFETESWLMENQVKLMIQKVLIWRYDCSYSDAYLIKTSPDLTLNNYTKQAFTGSQTQTTEDMRRWSVKHQNSIYFFVYQIWIRSFIRLIFLMSCTCFVCQSKNEAVTAVSRVLVAVEMLRCNRSSRLMQFTVPSLSVVRAARYQHHLLKLIWSKYSQKCDILFQCKTAVFYVNMC